MRLISLWHLLEKVNEVIWSLFSTLRLRFYLFFIWLFRCSLDDFGFWSLGLDDLLNRLRLGSLGLFLELFFLEFFLFLLHLDLALLFFVLSLLFLLFLLLLLSEHIFGNLVLLFFEISYELFFLLHLFPLLLLPLSLLDGFLSFQLLCAKLDQEGFGPLGCDLNQFGVF